MLSGARKMRCASGISCPSATSAVSEKVAEKANICAPAILSSVSGCRSSRSGLGRCKNLSANLGSNAHQQPRCVQRA